MRNCRQHHGHFWSLPPSYSFVLFAASWYLPDCFRGLLDRFSLFLTLIGFLFLFVLCHHFHLTQQKAQNVRTFVNIFVQFWWNVLYAVTRFEPKPASGSRYIQCQSCSIGHFQNISPLPLPAAELNTDYELQPHGAPLDLGPIFAPGAFWVSIDCKCISRERWPRAPSLRLVPCRRLISRLNVSFQVHGEFVLSYRISLSYTSANKQRLQFTLTKYPKLCVGMLTSRRFRVYTVTHVLLMYATGVLVSSATIEQL